MLWLSSVCCRKSDHNTLPLLPIYFQLQGGALEAANGFEISLAWDLYAKSWGFPPIPMHATDSVSTRQLVSDMADGLAHVNSPPCDMLQLC